jgi:hypothetical protein
VPPKCREPLAKRLTPLIADEVQYQATGLAGVQPQSAAQLLEENRRTLGWPQEKDAVDFRDVHAFIEEIDGEQHVHFAVA